MISSWTIGYPARLLAIVLVTSLSCQSNEGSNDSEPLSPQKLLDAVDIQRLEDDVYFIAEERGPGSDHWQAVQDLGRERLAENGFAVELHDYGTGVNVIGTLAGQTKPEEIVLVSAHYDHIPGCQGADDDASGSAAVLEIARVLSKAQFDRTLVLALFDEEETDQLGSTAYAARTAQENKHIVVMITLVPIGYASSEPHSQSMPEGMSLLYPDLWAELEAREFRADWIGLVGNESATTVALSFAAWAAQIDLAEGAIILGENETDAFGRFLGRGDQSPFWDQGFPAIQISNTGKYRNPNAHCLNGQDAPATLDYTFLANVTRATMGTVAEALGVRQ